MTNTTKNTLTFTPDVFDPQISDLQAIAQEVRTITADPALMTKEDMELINTTKNKLVKFRTAIQKKGLELRAEANEYNKSVIAYEKQLIEIIEPEEQRLKELERSAKEYALMEERKKTLPDFIERLNSIGDDVQVTDEELLSFDPNAREAYYNSRLQTKLEADRERTRQEEEAREQERLQRERELQEAEDRIQKEQALAIERLFTVRLQRLYALGFSDEGVHVSYEGDIVANKDELRSMSDEEFESSVSEYTTKIGEYKTQKTEAERIAREKEIKEAEERARQEEIERRARIDEEEEKKRLADEESKRQEEERAQNEFNDHTAYQEFLVSQNYDAATDMIVDKGNVKVLYREVARFEF